MCPPGEVVTGVGTVVGPSGAVVVCAPTSAVWGGSGNSCPSLGLIWGVPCGLRVQVWRKGPSVAPPLSSCTSQQCWLASLVGPGFFLYVLIYSASHPSSLGLFPCSQPQLCPQVWPLESEPRQSAPIYPRGGASQDLESQTVALPVCAALPPLCPL